MDTCQSCNACMINGVYCHEIGCPDSWKDYKIPCHICGCDFLREDKNDMACQGCLEDIEGIEFNS